MDIFFYSSFVGSMSDKESEKLRLLMQDIHAQVSRTGSVDGFTLRGTPKMMLNFGDRGIDVSTWQRNIDWVKVAAAGIKFVFIKASESNFIDPMFQSHWTGAKAAGLLRGGYHYFRVETDPIYQANVLLSAAQDGELPLVVDVEGQRKTVPAPEFCAKLLSMLRAVEMGAGKKPMIYTGKYVWENLTGAPAWLAEYPLWIAQYPFANRPPTDAELLGRNPTLPIGATKWDYWQCSDKGTVNGVPGAVDLNTYCRS